mmetsp:Transcript_13985/g.26854  ORF Transcript_13985/g.26854 Transcript_13985/m.26854 type:complete len:220 (+) Transcript_13985:7754-8413(+)
MHFLLCIVLELNGGSWHRQNGGIIHALYCQHHCLLLGHDIRRIVVDEVVERRVQPFGGGTLISTFMQGADKHELVVGILDKIWYTADGHHAPLVQGSLVRSHSDHHFDAIFSLELRSKQINQHYLVLHRVNWVDDGSSGGYHHRLAKYFDRRAVHYIQHVRRLLNQRIEVGKLQIRYQTGSVWEENQETILLNILCGKSLIKYCEVVHLSKEEAVGAVA